MAFNIKLIYMGSNESMPTQNTKTSRSAQNLELENVVEEA